jgi:hypothetical protein
VRRFKTKIMEDEFIFYLACPECSDLIPIPNPANSTKLGDSFMVAGCFACNAVFDYDYEEIRMMCKEEWSNS